MGTKKLTPAEELALKLANDDGKYYYTRHNFYSAGALIALAKYIQETSDLLKVVVDKSTLGPDNTRLLSSLILSDPVDPDLVEAREVVAKWYELKPTIGRASKYREGVKDNEAEVQQALAAIKRGRELAGS